jgi:uncharacterized protein YcnI
LEFVLRTTRLIAVSAGTAASLFVMAGPALAHVTVHGPEAAQGGFAKLTFQVPTEKNIPTTKVEVDLPAAQPLAFVSVKQHPGWTITVTKSKLAKPLEAEGEKITEAVSKIVWAAQKGQGIKPGYFDEFDISAGFLPKADTMLFKALQTYSDGSVVRWIELPRKDGTQPDHPAPVLHLAASDGAHAAMDSSPSATPSPAASAGTQDVSRSTPVTVRSSTSDGTARGLGGTALGIALLAALLSGGGLFAAIRGRRG